MLLLPGAEVSFSKLTVEPFRGLVAKDVKLFESPARKRVVAKVDEMVVEANYAHAARGEPFPDALTVVDASLLHPLNPNRWLRHAPCGSFLRHLPK